MMEYGDFPLSQTVEATINSTTPSVNWDTIDAEFRLFLPPLPFASPRMK